MSVKIPNCSKNETATDFSQEVLKDAAPTKYRLEQHTNEEVNKYFVILEYWMNKQMGLEPCGKLEIVC